jgi:nitrile hydratase subunit beta
MPVYDVRFNADDIWPGNTEKDVTIYADLYEGYLDKASGTRRSRLMKTEG